MTAGEISQEERSWLALLLSGVSQRELSPIARDFRQPAEALELPAGELVRRYALPPATVERLRRPPPPRKLDAALRRMEEHGMRLLPISHPEYPRNLFHMRTPPPALFVKGALADIDALAIGIVGPRHATSYGLEVTTALVRDLAAPFTIVSGAALGIDSRAHATALRHGGRTIAVLGCGIDVDYPAQNRPLREQIAEEGGALVSIFPPGTQPLRGNFPVRNFVLAGLSLAVVVVEASARSGALVTARAAGEEGRPVYAIPGDINRVNSEGSNALLRDGAIALTSAADLVGDMEPMLAGDELDTLRRRRAQGLGIAPGEETDTAASPPLPATTQEARLLEAIRHSPTSHDDLMARFVPAVMDVGDFATALLTLEMDGHIHQMPGRVYAARL